MLLSVPKKLKFALQLIDQKKETEALRLLTMIINSDKTNTLANWALANIYIKKNQYVLAEMYLYDILYSNKFTKDINETKIRETLAYLYQKTGEFNKALIQYFLLKKHNKLSAHSVKQAIRMAIEDNNFQEAEILLKQIKPMGQQDGEIDYLDAVIEFHRSAFLSAERKLNLAIEKGYQNLEIDFLLGKIYFFTRKYNLALKHFENLSNETLNKDELESFMGQCFYYLKDYEATIQVIETFLQDVNRKNNRFIANMEYILGCAHESLGQINKAIEVWRRIDDYAPFFQPVKEKLFFYNRVVKEEFIRDLLTLPLPKFINKCNELLDNLGYLIKQKILEEEKSLEYICISQRPNQIFNLYFVHITRKSELLNIDQINYIMIRARRNRARYILLIAPYIEDTAKHYAEKNNVIIYHFDMFKPV